MRGIYVHIPFCIQACRYCDFFFSVSLHYQDEFTGCLVEEIKVGRKEYNPEKISTVYLGGGTPSRLSTRNIEKIMNALHDSFDIQEDAEITMECNPDDLDRQFLDLLRMTGFNRISIGVQSFHDRDLALMNRSHKAGEALRAITEAANTGFTNINIDLIFGVPGQSVKDWEKNIERTLALPVTHLSAYHLTFEEGTVFDHWRKKERIAPVEEEISIGQYRILREAMAGAGLDHYEISNFARAGFTSSHNLIYWRGEPYLGFGPSAHSFDGHSRWWNIASLKRYMEGIKKGGEISEREMLTERTRYHDYLITSLRTKWGVDPGRINDEFGNTVYDHFSLAAQPFLNDGMLCSSDNCILIHPDHWMVTDQILRKLFMD